MGRGTHRYPIRTTFLSGTKSWHGRPAREETPEQTRRLPPTSSSELRFPKHASKTAPAGTPGEGDEAAHGLFSSIGISRRNAVFMGGRASRPPEKRANVTGSIRLFGYSGIRVFGPYRLFATKEKEGNGSRKRSNLTAGGRGRPPSHKTLSFSGQKPPLENGEEDIPTPRWPEVERSIPFPLRHNDHPKTRPNMTLSIPKERTKRPRSITHLFEFRDIKVIWMKTHPISSL